MSRASKTISDSHDGIKAWGSLGLFHELQDIQVLGHLLSCNDMMLCPNRKEWAGQQGPAPDWGLDLSL